MADIEQQARELLAAEYAMAGSTKRADKIIAGFDCAPGTEYALSAIAAALRAAPEGYVLLPQMPSEAMIEAGWPRCELIAEEFDVLGAYADLISAAPSETLATVTPPRDLRTKLGEAS